MKTISLMRWKLYKGEKKNLGVKGKVAEMKKLPG